MPPSRRTIIRNNLKENEIPFTFTSFPRLGAPGVFTEPYFDPTAVYSLFLPEEIMSPHVRYRLVMAPLSILMLLMFVLSTLDANTRMRRGSKIAINLPIFMDENVPRPFIDPTIPWERLVDPEDSGL